MSEHLACHAALESTRAEYRQQLDGIRNRRDADGAIGRGIRRMLLPGVKRRTYRRDELQSLVDAADRAAGSDDSDG
jgi:hypothetical protein